MNQEIPFKRFAVEVIVIVGSILLAFAIDAWWSESNDRETEITLLQSLHEDLVLKRSWAEFSNRFNQTILDSASTLLQASQDSGNNLTIEEVNLHIFNLLWYNPQSDWDSVPLDTLMGGGNAARITNQDLLRELVSLEARFRAVRQFSRDDENFRFNILTPFLIENSRMLHLNLVGEHRPADPTFTWNFPDIRTTEQYDHRYLLDNIEFRNLLSVEINRKIGVLNQVRGIDALFEVTIRLLEEELN